MFDISNYYEAKSLKDGLEYLKANRNIIIIAGGTDVLIKIREGRIENANIMGIRNIESLKSIYKDNKDNIHIGPMVDFTQLEESKIINEHIPYLGKAGGTMGGPQIRNVSTIGGNICNGATSADSATTLFCLDAKLQIMTSDKKKIVDIKDLYLGPGRVDLKDDEMLTDIIIKKENYEGYKGKYMKFARRNAMDIATLGCAVLVKVENDVFTDLRISCGVAAPTPVRCYDAEDFGRGKAVNLENIMEISKKTISNINARDSWRGSKAFREHLVVELTKSGIIELVGGLEND